MTDVNQDDQKIKSDPRYSDFKKIVKICMSDIIEEDEKNKGNPPKQPSNDDDNIFDRLGKFFSKGK